MNKDEEVLFIRILEVMFVKKRQFSYECIGSFIKELSILIEKMQNKRAFSYTLLFIIKLLFSVYSYPMFFLFFIIFKK